MQDSADKLQGGSMQLLYSVAEQLKTPLSIISRQAELDKLASGVADPDIIHTQANTALTLVESYLLGLQLAQQQTALALEPVSVSSLLVEVAHELDGFAKQYGVGLELQIAGKYEPVMTSRPGLRAALLSVGYAMLEGDLSQDRKLSLAVHKTPHGIVTGVYGYYDQLHSRQWRQALALQGQARQPFKGLCSGSAAGLYVAEAILQAMATRLRVGRHLKQQGLATTLLPSQQLQFV